MDTLNRGIAQAGYPPTWLSPLMPLGSHGLHLGDDAAFSIVHPEHPVNLAEFRPRIRSLPGLHVSALASNNATPTVGPEAFDARLVHWLTRTSDTLIVISRDVIGDTAAKLEVILRRAQRAVLVITDFEHQNAWAEALRAQARAYVIVHRMFVDAVGQAA